jgi:hypothetical protein
MILYFHVHANGTNNEYKTAIDKLKDLFSKRQIHL